MPGTDDPAFPKELRSGLLLHVGGFPITSSRQYRAQLEMSFPEMLERDIVVYNGTCQRE
jgi:hypothetical protein